MAKTNTKQKNCVHYWIIEAPDGVTSFGKCKYCGIIREFSNDWLNPNIEDGSSTEVDYLSDSEVTASEGG